MQVLSNNVLIQTEHDRLSCSLQVVLGVLYVVGSIGLSLVRLGILDELRRYASPQLVVADDGTTEHQGTGSDDGTLADVCTVKDGSTHAYECTTAHMAGVEGSIMPYGDIIVEPAVLTHNEFIGRTLTVRAVKEVADVDARAILHITAVA